MVCVIIAAAGQGKRMGSALNKVLLPLAGQPVLAHTVRAVCQAKAVTSIILTAAQEEIETVGNLLASLNLTIPWQVVAGGSERQYSIANALKVISTNTKIVVVHDGARPLAEPALFNQVIAAACEERAAIAGVPVKDTIKSTDSSGWVTGTPDRHTLWSVQTPQAFDHVLLAEAYNQAMKDGYLGTDDAALVERLGTKVKIVFGNYQNIKITTPEDLQFAETVLGRKQEAKKMIRAGIGYDVHRLVPERKLILGGVEIPYELGLEGHSDADVVLHAIKDALLGAAALGDILGYLGINVAIRKREEIFNMFSSLPTLPWRNRDGKERSKDNKQDSICPPKILDTSVIIDGRIADICKSGFIEGALIIPTFVLEELQHIADSSDLLKRNRGRRGLDILNRMQKELDLNVQIENQDFDDIAEVDSKLIKLGQLLHAKVITNDYNLNKVAELQGVSVLNINELSNAVKPVVLPGEEMIVHVVKDGKEFGQGVAYLDDGTMIVVDGGKKHIGETVGVLVTSVLQTAAGRMIFAKPKLVI